MTASSTFPCRAGSKDQGGGRLPPDDGGGKNGWGGPPSGGGAPLSNAHFMMVLMLIASSMLFLALVGSFIVLRSTAPVWPPAGSPSLPGGLSVSTVLIVISSLTLVLAQRQLSHDRQAQVRSWLLATTLLGAAFLVLQVICWRQLVQAGFLPRTSNYGGKFYLLTWAHGLHALAGVAALAWVTIRALAGAYGSRRHLGVDLAAMFWHFVGVIWLAVFLLLKL